MHRRSALLLSEAWLWRALGSALGLVGVEVPLQVVRQPLHDAEARLAFGAVAPGARDFGDAIAVQVGLHRELQSEFEAGDAFDTELMHHACIVKFEAVGGVMRGNAAEPVQGETT